MRTSSRGRAIVRRVKDRLRALRIKPFALVVILGACLLVSLYLVRFATIAHLRQDVSHLAQQERQALVAQEEWRDRLDQKDNPEAIEDLARRLLGLVMPGEEKVIFIEGK